MNPLHIFLDQRGHWRWVAFSSTAYEDRGGQIVSTKALNDDCDRADHDGDYGPLLWWHMPDRILGDCDFNAMHGRVLIESGTFRSEKIARAAQKAASGLEISLGFLHPPRSLDAAGVYHAIRRFERSLLPKGKASNRYTAFMVRTLKGTSMSSRTGQNPRVADESNSLEAMLDGAALTAAQRNKCWDTWVEKGLPAALGLLGVFKARYKAAPAGDEFDQLGQQFAEACRARAMTAGADRAQVLAMAQAVIAQLRGTKPPTSTKLTDSGKLSTKQAPAKPADPYAAAVGAAFGPENPAARPEMTMQQAIAEVAKTRPEAPKDPLQQWHADKHGGGDIR